MGLKDKYKFGRAMRIRTAGEFDHVFSSGRRVHFRPIMLIGLVNDLGHPRLGISVPKRFGRAWSRNRVKRLTREAFRLSQHELPAVDIICVPRPGRRASLDRLRKHLVDGVGQLAVDQ